MRPLAWPNDGGYANAGGQSRLNDFLALWPQAHMPSVTGRSHRPRSTWPDQARLAFLAVTHRYERTNCLWLEPFQIDALMFVKGVG